MEARQQQGHKESSDADGGRAATVRHAHRHARPALCLSAGPPRAVRHPHVRYVSRVWVPMEQIRRETRLESRAREEEHRTEHGPTWH